MGNSQSPAADPRFLSTSRAFNQMELEDLKSLFVSLAAQSQSDDQYISPSVFQAYFGHRGPLGNRLFDLVTQNQKDQKVTYQDLVIAKWLFGCPVIACLVVNEKKKRKKNFIVMS